jgi:hypothetical protein
MTVSLEELLDEFTLLLLRLPESPFGYHQNNKSNVTCQKNFLFGGFYLYKFQKRFELKDNLSL